MIIASGVFSFMNKRYKVLLTTIIVEFILLSVLNRIGFKVQTWIGNAIGLFLVIFPIETLLFLLSKDEKFSANKKLCFNLGFWYLAICYLLGLIVAI